MKPTFEHAVNTAIATNSVTVVWDFVAADPLVEYLEFGCLAVFIAELFVRLHRTGWDGLAFWRSPWNVIALSLAPALGADTSLLRLARVFRTAHWVRHAAHFRWLRYLHPISN